MRFGVEDDNSISTVRDPIGLELIVAVLSLGVSVVATLNQFGLMPKREPRSKREFKRLKAAVLRAQNQLDDVVLTFERYASYSERPIGNVGVTLSGTIMYLQERDYQRWNDLRLALDGLIHEVSDVLRELRKLEAELDEPLSVFTDKKLLKTFDDLMLNLSHVTVHEFVGRLRNALNDLSASISQVIRDQSNVIPSKEYRLREGLADSGDS